MTKKSQYLVGVVLITLGLLSSGAFASEETGHHDLPHHHLALFAGGGFERDENSHEENGYALGLKYEMQFGEKWGAGLDVEYLGGDSTHRSWATAIPLSYHLNESWRLFAGPGVELDNEKENDKFLMRVGASYEISIHQRWSLSPEFVVDFVEGGAKTYVLGIAVGYGF